MPIPTFLKATTLASALLISSVTTFAAEGSNDPASPGHTSATPGDASTTTVKQSIDQLRNIFDQQKTRMDAEVARLQQQANELSHSLKSSLKQRLSETELKAQAEQQIAALQTRIATFNRAYQPFITAMNQQMRAEAKRLEAAANKGPAELKALIADKQAEAEAQIQILRQSIDAQIMAQKNYMESLRQRTKAKLSQLQAAI